MFKGASLNHGFWVATLTLSDFHWEKKGLHYLSSQMRMLLAFTDSQGIMDPALLRAAYTWSSKGRFPP